MPQPVTTAIAGSLPKPAWLAQPEKLWAPWQLSGETLEQAKRDAMRLAVDDQLRAGIGTIGDGEQTRQHFVTTFIEHLDGVDFARRKTMRIRDRYDAEVPVVAGPVSRKRPVFVDDARRLRLLTDKPIKFTLPGPMTMIDTLFDEHYAAAARSSPGPSPRSSTRRRRNSPPPASTSSSSTSQPSTSSSTRCATGA